MAFYLYILRTSKNTLYIGQTNNLDRRLKEHNNKASRASKYIKSFESFNHVYTEIFENRGDAMRREIELKKLTKAKKEQFLKNASTIPNQLN